MECPECKGKVVQDGREYVCSECGLVIDRPAGADSQKPKNSDLGSVIDGVGPEDWKGVSQDRKPVLKRLQGIQDKETLGYKRSPENPDLLSKIDSAISTLGLPRTVKDEAYNIIGRAKQQNLTQGRALATLAAVSVSLASRELGYPLRDSEVHEHFGIRKTEFNLNYRFLKRSLNIQTKQPTPQAYVSRYCSIMKVPSEAEARAKDIVSAAGELCGRLAPSNVAVAAIYLSSRISEGRLSNETRVAGITITSVYRRLCEEIRKTDPECNKCGQKCLLE